MAAPTDVRVEAFSQNDTQLYWVYPGSAGIGVWRSLDGSSYAVIGTATPAALTFNDTFLAAGTNKLIFPISGQD